MFWTSLADDDDDDERRFYHLAVCVSRRVPALDAERIHANSDSEKQSHVNGSL